jgi:hypothetical protein
LPLKVSKGDASEIQLQAPRHTAIVRYRQFVPQQLDADRGGVVSGLPEQIPQLAIRAHGAVLLSLA